MKVVFGGKGQSTSYSGHILFDLGSDESTDWGLVMSAIWLTLKIPKQAGSPATLSTVGCKSSPNVHQNYVQIQTLSTNQILGLIYIIHIMN